MNIFNRVLALLCCSIALTVQGKEHIFLVGGGDRVGNSQVQIEMNVKWIAGMLQDKGRQARVFFTDGQAPTPDVLSREQPATYEAAALQALTRVLGEHGDNYLHFRNSQLTNIESSTDASGLTAVLKEAFASIPPGDSVFFIYQGHGSWEDDSSDNALQLWNQTRLSAREFETLLEALDPGVQFRFFFPQCYSGAFLRLADATLLAYKDSTQAAQCGFTAVAENEASEGCTVSIKVGDYRDYSTYFFAALNGKTRLGDPLNVSPDENGDGEVSLYEAHLYSLDNGYSTDLSRSTSEDFLEQWQPWYLKWKADMSDIPDNLFGQRVSRIAANNGYAGKGRELIKALFSQRGQYELESKTLRLKQVALQARSTKLREGLKMDLLNRWPQVSLPYTSRFKDFMNENLGEALTWINSQETYQELVVVQDKSATLAKEALDLQRKNTQVDKIFRMILLSRILEQLKAYGSSDDMAAYQSLLACEERPL